MQLRTFSAGTMAEALVQVKNEMGGDAVILHTRTYHRRRWLGLRRVEVVEITAGNGLNVASRGGGGRPRGARPQPPAGGGVVMPSRVTTAMPRPTNPTLAALAASRQVGHGGGAMIPAKTMVSDPLRNSRQILETPVANTAAVLNLTQEMATLKSMVKDLVKQSRQAQAPNVPEDLLEHYTQLIQSQVASDIAQEILSNLRNTLRPDQLRNPQLIQEKLSEQLEKMLPVSGPITRKKRVGPHVVALIGPTGVGKTTTIAKLAANLKLREEKTVGLITIDTYRIAAVDQLKKYADIIGSPLAVVGSPEELREAIDSMVDCEFVLIDTAGRSPTDTLKLQELKNFLQVAEPDEVHLVLSSTASQENIESAALRFGNVRVDKILFTKLDESVHVGVVLNVARKLGKALSYVTTGQDVPDDIEEGKARRLAQLILSGASV
jgi:flagellar biosynthesis protein FlhF